MLKCLCVKCSRNVLKTFNSTALKFILNMSSFFVIIHVCVQLRIDVRMCFDEILNTDCHVLITGVSVQVFSLSAFPLHYLETFLFELGETSLLWVVFNDLLKPFVLPSVEVVVLLEKKTNNCNLMQYNNVPMCRSRYCFKSFHPKPCVNMSYRMILLLSWCNWWLVLKCLKMHCYFLFNDF